MQILLGVIPGSKGMKGNFRNITGDRCFSLEPTHLEKADDRSYLIVIVVSVLAAFVILGTGVALLFLIYRPRKKGMAFRLYSHHSIIGLEIA